MGLRQWVAEKLRLAQPNKRTRARLQLMTMPGVPELSPFDIQRFAHDGYRRNVAIYGAIKFRMTGAQHVRLVAKRQNGAGELEELPLTHPLCELLERPNPEQSQEEWVMEMIQSVDVGGNAYIHKVRPRMKSAPPVELWNLRPDRMEIVPDKLGFIDFYHFPKDVPKDADSLIEFKDVIHWMDGRDPLNDFYGLSKIAVMARQGDIDNETSDFMRAFLLNAGMPAAALKYKTETPVGQEERERIKQSWKDEYGRSQGSNWWGELGQGEYMDSSVGGWGGLAVLDADVEWIKMGGNFQELDLDHVFGHTEARICAACGVPPILIGLKVGLDRATYSNAEQAEDHYWNNTGVPLFKGIAGKLTHGLAKEFDPTAVIEADFSEVRALKEDEDARVTRTSRLWEVGLLRLDEARGELGFEPAGMDEGGDEEEDPQDLGRLFQWQLPKKSAPNPFDGMNGNGNGQMPPGRMPPQLMPGDDEDEDEEPADEDEGEQAITVREQLQLPANSQDEPAWKRLHRAADAKSRAMRMAVTKAITDAQNALHLQLLMNALTVRDLTRIDVLTAQAWADSAKPVLLQRMKRHLSELFEEGSSAGNEDIETRGVGPEEQFIDPAPNAADEWAESHIGELIANVSADTRKMIRELVEKMFSEGLSTREMATKIRDRLGLTRPLLARLAKFEREAVKKGVTGAELERKVSRFTRRLIRQRAFLIARTEGIRAVSEGQTSIWNQAQQEGILPQDQKQFWITTEDDDVCKICMPMNGQERGIREMFTGGNGAAISAPPAHPGCRCARGLR